MTVEDSGGFSTMLDDTRGYMIAPGNFTLTSALPIQIYRVSKKMMDS
jgi:hypothetical protein